MTRSKSTNKRKQQQAQQKEKIAIDSGERAGSAGGAVSSPLDTAARHSAKGDPQRAERIYRQLLETDSGNLAALNDFGVLCRIQGRLEEAVLLYQKALAIEPDNPAVHRNLGNAHFDLQQFDLACKHLKLALSANPGNLPLADRLCHASIYSGNDEDAIRAARLMVEYAPQSPAVHKRLGFVLMHCRRLDEAYAAFSKFLHLDPGNESARHLLDVLAGDQPANADPATILANYGSTAAAYDKTIVKQLRNRTPQLLRGLLERMPTPATGFSLVLDLACGTGLMGVQLRSLARTLVGVDLSSEMVALARRKNIYDRLEVGDLVKFINDDILEYDLFSCSDALIHIGDLEPLVDAVSNHASPGTLFLFSTESADTGDYHLDPASYRYRHSPGYVREVLARHRFELIEYQVANIRVDRGGAVPGGLHLALKR